MTSINTEQILTIPKLIDEGKTILQVAEHFNVHERTINKWIKRLREEGVEVNTKMGRPKLKLN